jgi:xylitol oxidase
MNKRTFLKTSGALMTGAVLANLEACAPEKRPLKNWAGNLEYGTGNVLYPKSVAEVQEMVKNSKKLRGLGSRHSFNKIADSTSCQVSSEGLNQIIELNRTARTVTVEAGMKYGDLCTYLHESGFALHNLASLPHISIAGSIATATHGSGVTNGNLATSVAAIEFVTGAGEVVELTKDDDAFQGAVVGLGALGMVTKVTLNLLPTFEMQQVVYRNLAMSELEKNFLAIMSAGYSVSLFTDWKNKNVSEVWIKDLVKAEARPNDFYGAKLATQNLHPIESLSAETCTEQLGVPGPWYDRMPHFKMGFKPSAGAELQSEYFVPLEHGYEAMKTIEELSEKISPTPFYFRNPQCSSR